MSFRSTLGLLLTLVLLSLAYWGYQHLGGEQERTLLRAAPVFDLAPETIRELEIQQVGRTAAVAIREEDGRWQITAPNPTIDAFQPLWDRVAGQLAGLVNHRSILSDPSEAQLADYGLDEPKLRVYAEAEEGTEISLHFGFMEPTQTYRYALLNGETLFLVEDNQYFELNRTLLDLRNRFTVDDREADILRFEFTRVWTGREGVEMDNPPEVGEESVNIVLERDSAEAPWRMLAPADAAANQEVVDELVAEIQFAVGRNFVDNPESLADYGFEPASVRITLADDAEGREQRLYFGNLDRTTEQGGIYVMKEGQDAIFQVDAHVATLFPRSPYAFRERRLLSRQASELERIEVRGHGADFTLALEEGAGWRVVSPQLSDVSSTALSTFVAQLKSLSAMSFPEGLPEEYGLDQPDAWVDLTFEDGETAQLLFKWHEEAPDYYFATQDSGDVVRMEAAVLDRILVDPNHFRSRDLMRFSRLDAVMMNFTFEERDYVLERVHGSWLVRQPANRALDNQSDADRLINALSPLRATAIESTEAGDPADYGFDAPLFTFQVLVQPEGDPDQAQMVGPLTVGAITVDNDMERYATMEGREGVFRVSQELITQIRDILRGIDTTSVMP